MEMAVGRVNLKTLYIMQILNERTFDGHPLNSTQIGEILKNEYGIELNRRTIYAEIEKLTDAGMDIVCLEGKYGAFHWNGGAE